MVVLCVSKKKAWLEKKYRLKEEVNQNKSIEQRVGEWYREVNEIVGQIVSCGEKGIEMRDDQDVTMCGYLCGSF